MKNITPSKKKPASGGQLFKWVQQRVWQVDYMHLFFPQKMHRCGEALGHPCPPKQSWTSAWGGHTVNCLRLLQTGLGGHQRVQHMNMRSFPSQCVMHSPVKSFFWKSCLQKNNTNKNIRPPPGNANAQFIRYKAGCQLSRGGVRFSSEFPSMTTQNNKKQQQNKE